jgi:uncharacterized protein (DUF2164 family)
MSTWKARVPRFTFGMFVSFVMREMFAMDLFFNQGIATG